MNKIKSFHFWFLVTGLWFLMGSTCHADITIGTSAVVTCVGSPTITTNGNWVNNGTFTAGSSTVNFNASSGTQTINSGGTGATKRFSTLTKSNAGTAQFITNNVEANALTVNAGVLDLNGKNFTFTTASTAASNLGTIQLWGSETLTNVSNLDIDSGTVQYVGDGAAVTTFTIKDFGATDYYNLTINSTDANDTFQLAAASPLAVAGNLTVTNGTFDDATNNDAVTVTGDVLLSTNDTVSMGSNTWTVSGNWQHNNVGTLSANTSTLVMNGTSKTLTGSTTKILKNVTIPSGATISTQGTGGGVRIDGILSVTGTLTAGDQGSSNDLYLTSNSDLRMVGATGVITGGSTSTLQFNDSTVGITQKDSGSVINIHRIYYLSQADWVAGTYDSALFDIAGGSGKHVTVGAGTSIINGDFTLSTGSTVTVDNNLSNASFDFRGNVALSGAGTITWTKGSGTITLSGGGSATQTLNFLSKSIEALTVNDTDGGIKKLTGDVTATSAIVSAGTFLTNGYELTSLGALTVSGGTLDGTDSGGEGDGSYIYVGGSVDFTGGAYTTATSTIVQNGTGSTTFTSAGKTLNNLIINDGLIGYWKMDEASANTCTGGVNDSCDSSGYGYDGAWYGNAAQSSTVPALKFNNPNSITLDGTGDYVVTQSGNFISAVNAVYSVFAWVYPNSVSSIQGIWNFGEYDDTGYATGLGIDASGKLCWTYNGNSSCTASTLSVSANQWSHVGFVRSSSTVTMYVNGVSASISDSTNNLISSDPYLIGAFATNGGLEGFFNGKIDDVRVYNRGLSVAEIAALASGTHPGAAASGSKVTIQDALDVNGSLTINSGELNNKSGSNYAINVAGSWWNNGGIFTNNSGGTVTIDGTSGTNTIQAGNQPFNNLTISGSGGTWNLNQSARVDGNLSHTAGTVNTSGYDWVVTGDMTEAATVDWSTGSHSAMGSVNLTGATITPGTSTLVLNPSGGARTLTEANKAINNVLVTSTDGLVHWWKLDDTASPAVDSGSGANNGTWQGNATASTNVTPVNFSNIRSATFDGAADYVSATLGSAPVAPYTLSAWFNTAALTTQELISLGPNVGNPEPRLLAQLSTSGKIVIEASATKYLLSTKVFAAADLNKWWHVAVTVPSSDVSTWNIYINGVNDNGTTSNTGTYNDPSTVLQIGYEVSGNYSMNGQIDDVRIYNRALTADEIKALYRGHPLSATGTVTLQDTMDVNGNMILGDGTFAAGAQTIKIAKNWTNSDATFTYGTSTVDFDDDAQNNTISGSTTFYNFKIDSATAKTVTFESGKTQTIAASGTLTLAGAASNLLTLAPGTAATPWNLTFNGTAQSVTYTSPSYSDASGGTAITATGTACGGTNNDGGNNTNWTICGGDTSGAFLTFF